MRQLSEAIQARRARQRHGTETNCHGAPPARENLERRYSQTTLNQAHIEVAVKRPDADCTGFRIRDRPISASNSMPERSCACETVAAPRQQASLLDKCSVSAAQLWAAGWPSRNTSAVGIFSITRAKRNQVD